jgi:hypothetical protein
MPVECKEQSILFDELGIRRTFYLLAPFLIVVPIILQQLRLPVVSFTYGPRHVVFELLGMVLTLTLVAYAVLQIRNRRTATFRELLPILAFTGFALYFVIEITEYHPKSTDWLGYESVGNDLLEGRNPYQREGFIYPPLLAQGLAGLYSVVAFGAGILKIPHDRQFLWDGVFYVYQCFQFFLLIAAYLLSYRFVRSLGWNGYRTSILLILLFVLNVPLLRTLRHHQVNLWLLDLLLVAIVLLPQTRWLGGAAIALAAHIKLYPATILLPLVLLRQFRLIMWIVLSGLFLLIIETKGGTDFTLWQGFLASLTSYSQGTAFRDNSTHSLLWNMAAIFGINGRADHTVVNVLTWILRGGVVVWFVARFRQRERTLQTSLLSANDNSAQWLRKHRWYGNVLDAIPLALLLSPLVWEHHFVFVMPFLLWVIATVGSQKPWQIGGAAFLIYAIPVFDVFPISYHRIAGLVLLTMCARPTTISQSSSGPTVSPMT